jgi:DNA-binding PadR family transcriptional regulator
MKGRDVILGLLMRESMSGYDIKQYFETVFCHFFDASYGTIYPTLSQMEKEGYIAKEVVIQEGKPNKNVFSITEKGKILFYEYLCSPIEDDVIRSDFLMRLHFGEYVEKSRLIAWIDERIQVLQSKITHLEEDMESCNDVITPSQKLCIEIGLAHYRAYLATLQRIRERFVADE